APAPTFALLVLIVAFVVVRAGIGLTVALRGSTATLAGTAPLSTALPVALPLALVRLRAIPTALAGVVAVVGRARALGFGATTPFAIGAILSLVRGHVVGGASLLGSGVLRRRLGRGVGLLLGRSTASLGRLGGIVQRGSAGRACGRAAVLGRVLLGS